MQQDPFKNFKPLNPPKSRSANKPKAPRGDSFVEQLRSIGSSVTNSLKTDVVKGAAQGIYEQLVGSAQSGQAPSGESPDTKALENFVREREQAAAQEADQSARSEERAHFERAKSQEKVLFNFADEQLRKEIDEVRQELALLVKSMGQVERQIEQAVIQNIVNPGLYHKTFLANLKSWLIFMRKSLEDASLWLSVSAGRKQKGHFWQQTQKSGTKYSMSQERASAMSIG